LTIDYRVLPQVYKLDKPMEEYSPIGETFTLEKIAELMRDVWWEVEVQGGFDATGLDPDNTAFVIFHAGIGRDVELTGTSLDITPFDLPSITLDEANLSDLLDNPFFDGFWINNGAFRVNNSMLIPRTQSRRGTDISNNEIVFPLSINGLLCASIGSYLGLPDLFNTENGQPAIGRFGLMDGAGFFAYNGLLPPEPSAWEKVFLGWETPISVSYKVANPIQLTAGSLNQPNSIAKIELSSTEYFLVENRHRDPNLVDETSASVTITTRSVNGDLLDKTFTNLDEDFIFQASSFDTMLTPGTIVDVSNFDWSLPGGIDIGDDGNLGTEDDRHLNGGILIWHINEGVLASQLDRDRVNANSERRGIDLEEGDGAQDIGKSAGLLDNSPTFGYAFDFWWAGNDYRVITRTNEIDLNPNNEFGPETYPNNNSNSGARSGFELYEFSDNLPVASFRIQKLSQLIDEILAINIDGNSTIGPQISRNGVYEFFPSQLSLYHSDDDTLIFSPVSNFAFSSSYPDSLIELYDFDPVILYTYQQIIIDDHLIALAQSFISKFLVSVDLRNKNNLSNTWGSEVFVEGNFMSSQTGDTLDIEFTDLSFLTEAGNRVSRNSGYEFRSEIINNKYVGINGNTVEFVGENIPDYLASYENRLFAGTIQANSRNYYYLFEDGRFSLVDPSKEEPMQIIFE
ncbi:MAG: hypothetical protein ACPGGA_09610, partial [Balneolaceae bacterium]